MRPPLVSIVTVVYNGENFIEKTIQSVLNQTYKNIEYIIIDGGSIDGTVKVIETYKSVVDYWVSEKDSGIYDAMNKGMKVANGDFIIFMNGGDIFYRDDTLKAFVKHIGDEEKVYFGRAKIVKEDIEWLYPNEHYTTSKSIERWLNSNLPNHQAMFFPKKFYKHNVYNLVYKIASDADYKYRAKKACGFTFIEDIVCEFELGGVSSAFGSFRHTRQLVKDVWHISIKHNGFIYAIVGVLKISIKYFIGKLMGNLFLNMMLKKWRS
jgi:glycosyltransferase involved in cell wall biosynthesis